MLSIVFTAGVGNTVSSTDLVCDLIAKVIPLLYNSNVL